MSKQRSLRTQNALVTAITIFILTVFAFCQVFPFYLQLVSSLQPQNFIPDYDKIYLWPVKFSFVNFIDAFVLADMGTGFKNSLISAGCYTFLSLCVALVMGYVLGKKNFYGKTIVTVALVSTMIIPGEILMVPNYLLIIKLNMLNKLTALILPGIVNIFGIFLVKQFMNTIPDSILESVEIDGAGEFTKIVRIILPLCLPVVATYCILTFVSIWNDYLWPMIVLRTIDQFTIQLKVKVFNPMFADQRDQVLMAAALMGALIPVLVIYGVFQRQFIEGVSISGLK